MCVSFLSLDLLTVPSALYLLHFHPHHSSQLPPATQITQCSLSHTLFSMIYPRVIFIWFDLFKILHKPCQGSLTGKSRERQEEQTCVNHKDFWHIRKAESPRISHLAILPQHHYAETHPPLFESRGFLRLIVAGLNTPRYFPALQFPCNYREMLLASKVDASRNVK